MNKKMNQNSILLMSKVFQMEDNKLGQPKEKRSDSDRRGKDRRTSNRCCGKRRTD